MKTIGFIGSGNMGEAMIGAILKAGLFDASRILSADVSDPRRKEMENRFGIRTTEQNSLVFNTCDVVVLAVKPQQMTPVLEALSSGMIRPPASRKLILSIAAGITLKRLESLLYANLDEPARRQMPIIRVMPNTPALVLSGMSGMAPNAHCSREDLQQAKTILEAMGQVIEVPEDRIDAVTAMSGSGPAYFFYVIEAMIEAGVKMGFDHEVSRRLAVETAAGAVKMLQNLQDAPRELRRKVTSPGGTTEAAISLFETRNLREGFIEGILAAEKRSKELSGS